MESEISYKDFIDKTTLKSHSEMLNLVKNGFQEATKLGSKFALFFDANVLLRTYSISFKAREKLLTFYHLKRKEIHITDYIQKEYIRNREDVMNRFFDNVTNKIPNDFKSEVIAQIGSYLDRNKIIFRDYPNFDSGLNLIKEKCEKLHNELLAQVESKRRENSELMYADQQLSILSESNCLQPLGDTINKRIKSQFDELVKGIDGERVLSIMNKPGKVFPGMGDVKEKPENPYGDFIIFHELMTFARSEKKDIIFLTYDTTKGDWMRKDKKPHLHYIDNFYLNTGQIIYILDAERVFEDLLDISFKSLIQIKDEEKSKGELLTLESLSDLLSNRFQNHLVDSNYNLKELYLELVENGYNSIDKIEFDLNRADAAFDHLIAIKENSINRFTQIGNLRIRLELSNSDYKMKDKPSGIFKVTSKDFVRAFQYLVK